MASVRTVDQLVRSAVGDLHIYRDTAFDFLTVSFQVRMHVQGTSYA